MDSGSPERCGRQRLPWSAEIDHNADVRATLAIRSRDWGVSAQIVGAKSTKVVKLLPAHPEKPEKGFRTNVFTLPNGVLAVRYSWLREKLGIFWNPVDVEVAWTRDGVRHAAERKAIARFRVERDEKGNEPIDARRFPSDEIAWLGSDRVYIRGDDRDADISVFPDKGTLEVLRSPTAARAQYPTELERAGDRYVAYRPDLSTSTDVAVMDNGHWYVERRALSVGSGETVFTGTNLFHTWPGSHGFFLNAVDNQYTALTFPTEPEPFGLSPSCDLDGARVQREVPFSQEVHVDGHELLIHHAVTWIGSTKRCTSAWIADDRRNPPTVAVIDGRVPSKSFLYSATRDGRWLKAQTRPILCSL